MRRPRQGGRLAAFAPPHEKEHPMARNDPDDLKRMQREALDMTNAAAAKTLEGFQKLTTLNMQTARAALEQSSEQIDALLSARDAARLSELVTSFAKLSPEKFAAYANAVYAISRETGTELGAMIEKQIAESNAQLAAAVQALAKNAAAGPGGANEFIMQSMNAAKAAYEQMQSAAQQFASGSMQAGGAQSKKR
jgi:phasin family protein